MTAFIKYKRSIVLIIFILMITGKIFYGAKKEYLLAEGLLKDEKHLSAITHYQRAMKWYIPVIGYTYPSAQRLWELGGLLESSGDIKMALISYRNLRSGFYSIRGFYNPGEEWIKRCDEKISLLSGEGTYRASAPDRTGTALILSGMSGWIACVLFFILKIKGYKIEADKKLTLSIIVLFIICYAVWVIGMLGAVK